MRTQAVDGRRKAAFAAAFTCLAISAVATTPARAEQSSFAQIERGRYLTIVGDCQSCHTAEDGEQWAGGMPVRTPFGTIYSYNLTSDPETGIGTWTNDQFYRAMHDGIAANGSRLYPAFPYPWFTKATRADVDAIRAYLRTLPAVKTRRPADTFPWPLSIRFSMWGWNTLFFTPNTYKPDPAKSAEWNRGAYLVEGLAHCGGCHTPTNLLGASKGSDKFQGGELDHWYAPSLIDDKRNGLGGWSEQEIVTFLKTGRTTKTVAYGKMAEVVENSTSKMTDADLKAIAVFLKGQAAARSNAAPGRPAARVAEAGEAIYVDTCSACHQQKGQGVPSMFPALAGDPNVQSDNPATVIRLILNGGHAAATDQRPTPVSMPDYGWKLSDAEVAAVASYIRSAWGNKARPVSASDVAGVRAAVQDATTDH